MEEQQPYHQLLVEQIRMEFGSFMSKTKILVIEDGLIVGQLQHMRLNRRQHLQIFR